MHARRFRLLGLMLLAAAGLAACNYPTAAPAVDAAATSTAAAIIAQLQAQLTALPPVVTPDTPTPAASDASVTPQPTPPDPTPTPVTTGCTDRVGFVADLSIPDNTTLAAGSAFTKTWRLRNNGTCTWTTDYALVFSDGEAMGAPASIPLAALVPAGSEIDLSIDLQAPGAEGTYRGDWLLQNAGGARFGIGPSGDQPFWVQIAVGDVATPVRGQTVVYSFVEHVCDGEWRSGVGLLPCPGTENDPNGFVVVLPAPRFENGVTEDEPAIYSHPQMTTNGVISGRFPAVRVLSGSYFQAIIGCAWAAEACDLTYQLNYRLEGGPLQNLAQWVETHNRNWRIVEVDLAPLAGQSVSFILAVTANGSPTQDQAYWLNPIILR